MFTRSCVLIVSRWLSRLVLPVGFVISGAIKVLGSWGWYLWSCAWVLICDGSVCRADVPQTSPECSSAKMLSCGIFTRQKRWSWRLTTQPSICWRQILNSSGNTFGTEPFSSRFVPQCSGIQYHTLWGCRQHSLFGGQCVSNRTLGDMELETVTSVEWRSFCNILAVENSNLYNVLVSFTFHEPALPMLGFNILILDIFCEYIGCIIILI